MAILCRLSVAVSTLAMVLAGCSSKAVRVGMPANTQYEVVGETRGGACGLLLFSVIPIGVNSRTERAYADALGSRGTALIDTQIQYQWWIIPYVGLLNCTVIKGTVIR